MRSVTEIHLDKAHRPAFITGWMVLLRENPWMNLCQPRRRSLLGCSIVWLLPCPFEHFHWCLGWGWDNFFHEEPDSQYWRLCAPWVSVASVQLWVLSCHTQYINEWLWLCSNLSLLSKTGCGPDLAFEPSFAGTYLSWSYAKGRLIQWHKVRRGGQVNWMVEAMCQNSV